MEQVQLDKGRALLNNLNKFLGEFEHYVQCPVNRYDECKTWHLDITRTQSVLKGLEREDKHDVMNLLQTGINKLKDRVLLKL